MFSTLTAATDKTAQVVLKQLDCFKFKSKIRDEIQILPTRSVRSNMRRIYFEIIFVMTCGNSDAVWNVDAHIYFPLIIFINIVHKLFDSWFKIRESIYLIVSNTCLYIKIYVYLCIDRYFIIHKKSMKCLLSRSKVDIYMLSFYIKM